MAASFSYEQDESSTELSIRVAVPPGTSKADVTVNVLAGSLCVSVSGHRVLDGTLYYDVDADSTSWALEGSGDTRALIIELTKAEPVDWDDGLFRVATADDEPLPELRRDHALPSAAPLEKLGEESKREDAPKQTDIWAELMSGKKRLLTKEGVVVGADAVRAALGLDLTDGEGGGETREPSRREPGYTDYGNLE